MQSRSSAQRPSSTLRFLLGLALAAGACVAPRPQDPVDSTGFLPASGLDDLQPADIAVAPVDVVLLEGGDAPHEAVREALYDGLIDRLYSPLPLVWVDGGGERDATLVVRILQWDRSKLSYDGTITARAEARLTADGRSLWAVELTRRLNRATSGEAREDVALAELSSAQNLAREILALLPERDPQRL